MRNYIMEDSLKTAYRDLVQRYGAPPAETLYATLSPREAEIHDAIAAGEAPGDTAKRLEISQKTVNTHRAAVLRKLGLDGNADVARATILRRWRALVERP